MEIQSLQRAYLSAINYLRDEHGQSLIEYGIILTVMIVAIMASSAVISGKLEEQLRHYIEILSQL
jgi:Flp pilus assembly pilin Flp